MVTHILLIGSGGREHALAEAMSKDSYVYSYMSHANPGIVSVSKKSRVKQHLTSRDVVNFVKKNPIDLAMIGPESPLEEGIVDVLEDLGIGCVGPRKDAAALEWDKSYCREILQEYKPEVNPNFWIMKNLGDVEDFFKKCTSEVAVKPAGLTGGKGVRVMGVQLQNLKDAMTYAKNVIKENVGGLGCVVIEEKMRGVEFTLHCITDGKNSFFFPATYDYPMRFEEDRGPKTGGMGAYATGSKKLPFMTLSEYDTCCEIVEDILSISRNKLGSKFRGILNAGFFLTDNGPRICELNVRFGDPEAMNLLSIFEVSWTETMYAIVEGRINTEEISLDNKASVCVYLVPPEYPNQQSMKYPFSFDENKIGREGAILYFSGAVVDGKEYLTTGSRAIAILAKENTLEGARETVSRSLHHIDGQLDFRKDIATESDIRNKISRMGA